MNSRPVHRAEVDWGVARAQACSRGPISGDHCHRRPPYVGHASQTCGLVVQDSTVAPANLPGLAGGADLGRYVRFRKECSWVQRNSYRRTPN